jgi:ATPase subunit of ABC transporter with duplicated ATPase domains
MRRDGTGKCPVKWYIDDLGKKRWVCFAHLAPYTRYYESSEQCWYTTCPGRSMVGYPLTDQELEAQKAEQARKTIKEVEGVIQIDEPKKSTKECDNYGCSNQISLGRKRYCSDKCRLQKSRADYEARNPNRTRKRKQEEKKHTPAKPPQPVAPVEGVCTSITCSNEVPPTRKAYCSDPCRKRAYVQRKRGLLKG